MIDHCLKKYLLGSLICHVFILIIGFLMSGSTTIRHTFVVLGVHSQKTSKTLFKRFDSVASLPKKSVCAAPKKTVPSAKQKILKQKKAQPESKPLAKKVLQTKPAASLVKTPKGAGVALEKKKQPTRPSNQVEKKQLDSKKRVLPSPQKKVMTLKEKVIKKTEKNNTPVEKTKKIVDLKKTKETEPLKKHSEESVMPEQQELSCVAPVPTEEKGLESVENMEQVIVSFADRDMISYERVIRQEIGVRWQPPLGVPKGTECTVRFQIARNGVVEDAVLVHRSNVLIFDLSVLRAARVCTFARCLWGKNFHVDFRQ